MSDTEILAVNDLVVSFGNVQAVKGISFSVGHGETVGIVGESGSGKSVTSLAVMGLLSSGGKIASGNILFRNKAGVATELSALTEGQLSKYRGNEIAMIFQEPMTSLNPVMRCGEQVMEAIMQHQMLSASEAKERTIRLFEDVKLPSPSSMFSRFPHQLSGGQKQRVMIAMAISCSPKLLIADEPTTALDVTVQKNILLLLRSLQRSSQMGMVFITHDLGVVAEIADKIVVMYKGSVVESGTVKDVFANPSHPYTRSLMACRPPLDDRPRRLAVVSDFMTAGASPRRSEIVPKEERKTMHEKLYAGNKILSVRNLCTWYPSSRSFFGKANEYTRAVDDVTFDVYEGETLGLVGESGCGKSTLGRTILKLAQATSGSILFRGQDITRLSERMFRPYRKQMQLIFQDPYSALNPALTVGQALLEPLRVHNMLPTENKRRNRVMELLEKVGLESQHYYRYPHEFSGGQRQRICIARALALEPSFIVCDESVSALDVSMQAQVLNLLNDLKREFRFTSIFISHDLGVVKYVSDRMIVMQKGRIEEMGDPDEVYRNPASDYTRNLIAAIPRVES